MAIYQIPVRNDIYSYTMRTTIDDSVYVLGFRYNNRTNRWIMDISTSAEEPIVMGIPVLINQDLLGRFKDERLPKGTFFAIDLTDQGNNPSLEDFGQNVVLLYSNDV